MFIFNWRQSRLLVDESPTLLVVNSGYRACFPLFLQGKKRKRTKSNYREEDVSLQSTSTEEKERVVGTHLSRKQDLIVIATQKGDFLCKKNWNQLRLGIMFQSGKIGGVSHQ